MQQVFALYPNFLPRNRINQAKATAVWAQFLHSHISYVVFVSTKYVIKLCLIKVLKAKVKLFLLCVCGVLIDVVCV
jgi:hypothetical protein